MTRSGTRLGDPRAVSAARDAFDRCHLIRLPAFLETPLAHRLADLVDAAPWELRTHYRGDGWTMEEPPANEAEHGVWGSDLHVRDRALNTTFAFLLNDRALFSAVQAITRCPDIQSFEPNIYKSVPGAGPWDDWHTDDDGARQVALSVNVGREAYEGGRLQVRRRGTSHLLAEVHNTIFGDALLLRIGAGLEHCLTPITGQAPRVAVAGWFTTLPSRFPALPF